MDLLEEFERWLKFYSMPEPWIPGDGLKGTYLNYVYRIRIALVRGSQ